MKKISTWVGITIILAVAVIAFGGVFAYEYFGMKMQPVIPAQQNQAQNTTTPVNQTAGWKTYSNDKWGFKMQYPNNFRPATPIETVGAPANESTFAVDFSSNDPDKSFEISIYPSDGNTDLKNYFSKEALTGCLVGNCYSPTSFQTKETVLGGIPALEGNVIYGTEIPKSSITETYALKGIYTYEIKFWHDQSTQLTPEDISLYTQLVSTFQFTSPNSNTAANLCQPYQNFSSVITYLKNNGTTVPIMLPSQLPADFTSATFAGQTSPLYTNAVAADDGTYSLTMSLDFNGAGYDCVVADSNAMGIFLASKTMPQYFGQIPNAETINLPKGIQGYYYETSQDNNPNIDWIYKGIYYQADDLHMSKQEAINAVTSAIDNVQ